MVAPVAITLEARTSSASKKSWTDERSIFNWPKQKLMTNQILKKPRFACWCWSKDEILFSLAVLFLGFSECHLQTCSTVAYDGIEREVLPLTTTYQCIPVATGEALFGLAPQFEIWNAMN